MKVNYLYNNLAKYILWKFKIGEFKVTRTTHLVLTDPNDYLLQNGSWQAVGYLAAHLVTISKYSRPLLISVLTTFASNGSLVVYITGIEPA